MPYLVAADLPPAAAGARFRALWSDRHPADAARITAWPRCKRSGRASSPLPLGRRHVRVDGATRSRRHHGRRGLLLHPPVARASGLPVLVDGDTGYGEALNVMHMVRAL